MNPTSQRFLDILTDGVTDAIRIAGDELAQGVDLDPGQLVTWLAWAPSGDETVNLYFCESDEGQDEEFVLTRHSDDGLLIGFDGPCRTLAEARRRSGVADEDWTEV